MEFLLADILIPTIDFICNGIEWVSAILFGTGTMSLAVAFPGTNFGSTKNTSVQNVGLENGKYSVANPPAKPAPATGPTPDQTFLQGAVGVVSPGAEEIVKDENPLRFPLSLASEGSGLRPMIRFTCFERNDDILQRRTCYFPCPANIAFADNANLGTIDLGMFGAGIDQVMNQVGGTAGAQVGGQFDNPIGAGAALSKTFGKGLSAVGVGEGLINNIKFGLRTVENPYQNTSYNGAGVRTFTFNFKMVAETENDAIEIKKIHEFFRTNMYAGRLGGREASSSAFLKYPSIWEVDFLTGISSSGIIVNKYLPAIYSSYLQNFNATFNTTAPTWYKDGAPLEVDISMTYQESRALERNDIENLSGITMNTDTGELIDNPTLEYNQISDKGISNKGTSRATGISYGDYSISTEE